MTDIDYEEFIAEKQRIGRTVDPNTARVFWIWGEMLDPYNLGVEIPPEGHCIGRIYFAITPDKEWIEFADLPVGTVAQLRAQGALLDEDNWLFKAGLN
jgi:hypothetical protein